MTDQLKSKDLRELKPRIVVMGVGGAGGNALNNMVIDGLEGVDFIASNTDAQALLTSKADKVIQLGVQLTEGLGAGSRAEIGAAAAEEAVDEIREQLNGAHMVFVTAGMGGGTGSGAAPVIARIARELGILTVGVVTKPFSFEGLSRMRTADKAVTRLEENVDTLIVIPNQNLFRVTNEETTFSDAFAMADKVLHSGIACITDLMVKEGLINLDFADVKIVMSNMGKSMMGSGIAAGENRGREAALTAISNPLLDDVTLEGAKGVLVSIMGGKDLTLYEVEQAAETIRKVVDDDANIIVGATFDEQRKGDVQVSILATGLLSKNQSQGQADERAKQVTPEAKAPMPFKHEPVAKAVTEKPLTATKESALVMDKEPVVAAADPLFKSEMTAKAEPGLTKATNPAPKTGLDEKKAKKEWVQDDDVTIKPMIRKKGREAAPSNVAKTAHEKGISAESPANIFTPAPVQPVANKKNKMPEIDDFSPVAQKALRAHKEDVLSEETVNSSLLARLSGLGKKMSRKTAVTQDKTAGIPAGKKDAESPSLLADSPVLGRSSHSEEIPVAMKMTEEEEMEIPSFFKRKTV